MSHLIPEQRADRNGRVVTRHVLPQAAQKAPLRSIPAVAPATDRVAQLQEFRKLNVLYGSANTDQINQLLPVAATVARAIEVSGKTFVRDFFDCGIYDDDSDWVEKFATICHFTSEAGGVKDANVASQAIYCAASHYGTKDLMSADSEVQRKTVELVSAVSSTEFLELVAGHGGSLTADTKRNELMDYVCRHIDDGTLQEKLPAMEGIGKFIDFWSDEHEEAPVLENLNYIELVELVDYTLTNTQLSPETTLSMVRAYNFRVEDVRAMIVNYDGAGALIEGSL